MAPLPTAAATSTNAPVTHMPIAHDAAAGADSGIAIKNTALGRWDFRRMMNQDEGRSAGIKSTQAATPLHPCRHRPYRPSRMRMDPLAANSKFTFENFVYGSREQSCLSLGIKLAARGRAWHVASLFIYGNRAWARRTKLFAIKNELLAEKSPEIKVKCSATPVHLDDLMTEFDRQRRATPLSCRHTTAWTCSSSMTSKTSSASARAWTTFSQLMDEFIRNNKKVVIAADRAPEGPEQPTSV